MEPAAFCSELARQTLLASQNLSDRIEAAATMESPADLMRAPRLMSLARVQLGSYGTQQSFWLRRNKRCT